MKAKKLVALLLAVVMVLGLGTTAFASSNEKVQINNMMVDASLVETQNEDVAEMEMVSPESTIATAAFDPSTNPNFAPIKNITVDWSNSTVEAAGAMQGRVRYNLTMPGAAGNLTGRTLSDWRNAHLAPRSHPRGVRRILMSSRKSKDLNQTH